MEYPNWFAQSAQSNFEQFLRPMSGQPHLRFLQLGVFTGDATEWLMDNIITGPNSSLTDVDTWEGSKELAHEELDFDDVYKTYIKKTARYKKGVRLHTKSSVSHYRGTTLDFLLHDAGCCDCSGYEYDFIYIDADHTTAGVLVDAEISWSYLKSGGLMAFDDYTWHHHTGDPRLEPKVGIDLFLHRHTGEYEILAVNDQVWIEKQ